MKFQVFGLLAALSVGYSGSVSRADMNHSRMADAAGRVVQITKQIIEQESANTRDIDGKIMAELTKRLNVEVTRLDSGSGEAGKDIFWDKKGHLVSNDYYGLSMPFQVCKSKQDDCVLLFISGTHAAKLTIFKSRVEGGVSAYRSGQNAGTVAVYPVPEGFKPEWGFDPDEIESTPILSSDKFKAALGISYSLNPLYSINGSERLASERLLNYLAEKIYKHDTAKQQVIQSQSSENRKRELLKFLYNFWEPYSTLRLTEEQTRIVKDLVLGVATTQKANSPLDQLLKDNNEFSHGVMMGFFEFCYHYLNTAEIKALLQSDVRDDENYKMHYAN